MLVPYRLLIVVVLLIVPLLLSISWMPLVLSQSDEPETISTVPPQFDMVTRADNLRRNHIIQHEQVLRQDNVNTETFGHLFSRLVDGHVYAQVLYAHDVTTLKGIRNLIFVATMSNMVYAFDADDPGEDDPVWVADLGPPAPMSDEVFGRKCIEVYGQAEYRDIFNSVGVVSTPVIDRDKNIMYVVALNKDGTNSYRHRISAIDIRIGEIMMGPEVVDLQVPGTGAGSSGGILRMDPITALQRSSLALHNGHVYFGFGAYCDTNPYHGWIAGYNSDTLTLSKIWCSTPNGKEGSVWNSGEGITIMEEEGYLLIGTANGDFDTSQKNYGTAVVILDPNQVDEDGMMKVISYSKPDDNELGLLGMSYMTETGYVATAGKNNVLWLIDTQKMTMDNSSEAIVQQIPFPKFIHGAPVWWKKSDGRDFTFVWGMYDRPKQFELVAGEDDRKMLVLYSDYPDRPFCSFPGGIMVLSWNGDADETAVLWGWAPIGQQEFGMGDSNHGIVPGQLYAFEANDISNLLWHSEQVPERDAIAYYSKFNVPTVAVGRVFVPTFSAPGTTDSSVRVYGQFSPLLLKLPAVYEDEAGGNRVILETLATGTGPLEFQWFRRTAEGSEGPIEGGNNKSITLTVEEWKGEGGTQEYWAEISNDNGKIKTPIITSEAEVLPRPLPPVGRYDDQSSACHLSAANIFTAITFMAFTHAVSATL